MKQSSMGLLALALAAGVGCGDSETKKKPADSGDCSGAACEGEPGDGDGKPGDGDGDTGDGDGAEPCEDVDDDGICDTKDTCIAAADVPDTDGDGVPDTCDVCENGDDALDADKDGVADACDLCPGDAGPRIVLWDGEGSLSTAKHADNGIKLVGCGYTRTSASDFASDLADAHNAVLVVDLPATLPELVTSALEALSPAVTAFANAGGGVIFSGPSGLWPQGARDLFGITRADVQSGPETFAPTSTSAALFALPFDLSRAVFSATSSAGGAQGLSLYSATIAAAYAETQSATSIARGMAGRAFGNAFALDDYEGDSDEDGVADVEELIANQLTHAVRSFRNEFYVLPYSYYTWAANNLSVLKRAAEFRYAASPLDRAPKIAVFTDAVPLEFHVYPDPNDDDFFIEGVVASTRAALEQAGVPADDITLLGDAEATQAALGSFDVIVLPEVASNLDFAAWKPVLLEHVHRGGRLVVLGNNAELVNHLADFGSSFGSVGTGDFAKLESDPFWNDITHIYYGSNTFYWRWNGEGSAPAQEVLATAANEKRPMLFRSLIQVQPLR